MFEQKPLEKKPVEKVEVKPEEKLMCCDCDKKEMKPANQLSEIHVSGPDPKVLRYCTGVRACMVAVNAKASE